MLKQESVIDFPKKTLCPDVWEKVVSIIDAQDEYQPTPELIQTIETVISEISSILSPKNNIKLYDGIHIIGSITSNQYTDNTDIDLHFYSNKPISKEYSEELTKQIRSIQQTKMFGTHPIELYVQPNKFQDFMSVGCYDYTKRIWEVGPDFKSMEFDPYSEYYHEIQKHSQSIIRDVRNIILNIYETAVVYIKIMNKQSAIESEIFKTLKRLLSDASKLYSNLRKIRSSYSSPRSKEEALKYRNSRKWHITDATFKLFDKYGYLAILKQFIEINELLTADTMLLSNEIVNSIISTIKKYLGNAEKLADSEKINNIVKEYELQHLTTNTINKQLDNNVNDIIKTLKIWLDSTDNAPRDYISFKDVNSVLDFIDNNINNIDVVDTNYDSNEYYDNGGNYNVAIDYLDFLNAKNIKIRIHTDDPIGLHKIRSVIKKNKENGWKEIFNII